MLENADMVAVNSEEELDNSRRDGETNEIVHDEPDGAVRDIASVMDAAIERDDEGRFVRVNARKAAGALVSRILVTLFSALFVTIQIKLTGEQSELREQLELMLNALQKAFRDANTSIAS